MLVWYVNDAYADNNVATHPGGGSALPVDARPAPFGYSDGSRPSNRRQPFDAAFGLQAVPETCLHKEVLVGKGKNQTVQELAACAPANAGIATFDDSDPTAVLVRGQPAELGQGRRAPASRPPSPVTPAGSSPCTSSNPAALRQS